jgi:hypothetical protein
LDAASLAEIWERLLRGWEEYGAFGHKWAFVSGIGHSEYLLFGHTAHWHLAGIVRHHGIRRGLDRLSSYGVVDGRELLWQ